MQKGYNLSKAIWDIVDMDGGLGDSVRRNPTLAERSYRISIQLSRSVDLFRNRALNDTQLLILIDMIQNRELWKKLLGYYPEDIISKNDMFFSDKILYFKHHDSDELIKATGTMSYQFTAFHNTLEEVRKIITSSPKDIGKATTLFYILAYRLRSIANSMQLCETLYTHGLLNKIFNWDRNGGVYINDRYLENKSLNIQQRMIESMSADTLHQFISDIVKQCLALQPMRVEQPPANLSSFRFFQPAAAAAVAAQSHLSPEKRQRVV